MRMRSKAIFVTGVSALVLVILWTLGRAYIAWIPGQDDNSFEGRSMNAKIGHLEFALGEKGDEVVKRADVTVKRSKVSTALLYDADNVVFRLRGGPHSIEFPPANFVLFNDDASDSHGISKIMIDIGLPVGPNPQGNPRNADVMAYDQQMYDVVTALVSQAKNAGWKRWIPPSEPRLTGLPTYPLQTGYLELPTAGELGLGLFASDPDVSLTWQDWQHLADSVNWMWVADDMRMIVEYTRAFRDGASPLRDGIRVTISTAASVTGASHPDEETRAEYAASLPKLLAQRAEREAKARAAGLEIDASYRNPPLAGIPVPEPESK